VEEDDKDEECAFKGTDFEEKFDIDEDDKAVSDVGFKEAEDESAFKGADFEVKFDVDGDEKDA
jgi:hypothetical protein